MSGSLGLSIGVANLVAARARGTPVIRRPVLTLFGDRPSEVGLPGDVPNPGQAGLVLRGFVERVGDPAPLPAADGTEHPADGLTANALEAMARTLGYGTPVGIAVPAYWADRQVSALRQALFTQPALMTPGGMPPATISDATAALAALYAKPGFPNDGVVALCDFGASGTSVTLTDAASNFRQIGPTTRYTEFSGDGIDQLMLTKLEDGAETHDLGNTAPMGPLSSRLEECRRAKEQLSAATMTVIPAEMPGFGQDVRLSRTDFEEMISEPLDRFIVAMQDILRRSEVTPANLAAAAIVGGGACIPLITARLSERLQVPIFTTEQPVSCAAIGAAVLSQQRLPPSAAPVPDPPTAAAPVPDPPTTAAPVPDTATAAGPVPSAPTEGVDGQPTGVSPAGWAIQAANEAAGESVDDDDASATYRALAWSQVDAPDPEPVVYVDDDDYVPAAAAAGPPPAARRRSPHWYSRPTVLISLTGAAAVGLIGAVVAAAFELTANSGPAPSAPSTTSAVDPSVMQKDSAQLSPSTPAPSATGSSVAAPPPVTTTVETTVPPTTTWATTRPAPTTTPATTPWSTTRAPTTTTAPTTTSTYPQVTTTRSYPSGTTTWPYPMTPQETVGPTTPPWGYGAGS